MHTIHDGIKGSRVGHGVEAAYRVSCVLHRFSRTVYQVLKLFRTEMKLSQEDVVE